MKYTFKCILFLLFIGLFSLTTLHAQTDQTTIMLVRHAEKVLGTDSLSEMGKLRAIELSRVLKEVSFSTVYCSQYQRTYDTALPLLTQSKQSATRYNTDDLVGLVDEIVSTYKGKSVLIVGHSNTLWPTMKLFGIQSDQTDLPDNTYDHLFILNITEGFTPRLLSLKFGQRSK